MTRRPSSRDLNGPACRSILEWDDTLGGQQASAVCPPLPDPQGVLRLSQLPQRTTPKCVTAKPIFPEESPCNCKHCNEQALCRNTISSLRYRRSSGIWIALSAVRYRTADHGKSIWAINPEFRGGAIIIMKSQRARTKGNLTTGAALCSWVASSRSFVTSCYTVED